MKQTSDKAWMAGVTTFIAVGAALAGFGEMPTDDAIMEAAMVVGGAGISAAVSAFLTWLKANHPIKGA